MKLDYIINQLKYAYPAFFRIDSNLNTKELYTIEDEICALLIKASEWLKTYNGLEGSIYKETVPYELLCLLDKFDPNASTLACVAYLEKHCPDVLNKAELLPKNYKIKEY